MSDVYLKGFLLAVSLCLDIGVVNTALINTAIRAGVRPALFMGLGSCVGDIVYAVLSLFGLALFLSYSPVRWILWIGGGAILLWLTWKMALAAWREAGKSALPADFDTAAVNGAASSRVEFLRGLALALGSPTSILWFAAVGGTVIAQSTDGSAAMNSVFLAGFFTGGVAWSSFLAILAGKGRHVIGHRLTFYCNVVSALLFAYFAVTVIANGYRTLL
ncbi:LysE family translocator [Paludibacterium paludis]|uniref:Lysine transporter LysE n=1 Tax=Paludibacterium paludis TaxID=1225769 RepID=A0A918U7B5_9NEIS|nr:LysE family transporter [Paludibacterium paludis]GGY04859.1 lysine transporter LysE [Paludibacterium paludis]